MSEAMFEPDRGLYMPSGHAVGPWNPRHLHGGATAALLVHVAERVPTLVSMTVVRLTVELFRPVPLRSLDVRTRVAREGKKIQLVEMALFDGETEVSRGAALRMRTATVAAPEPDVSWWSSLAGPEAGREPSMVAARSSGYFSGIDCRIVEGNFDEPGPGAAWFRIWRPIVAGRETTPMMRVAATADFGNGIGSVLDVGTWLYLNADVTVYVHREPRGDWLSIQSRSTADSRGVGLSESVLGDRDGPIARSLQALLLEPR